MDARFILLLPIAFGAGIITAVSPCVFPVLPILFAGGAVDSNRRRPYAIIVGLVASFAPFTLVATWLLDQLHLPQDFLRDLSIALLFLLAATLVVPQLGAWVERPLARVSGAISASAARLDFGWKTVAVTVAYALGAAIPMLAIAALGQRATGRLRAGAGRLRVALGV